MASAVHSTSPSHRQGLRPGNEQGAGRILAAMSHSRQTSHRWPLRRCPLQRVRSSTSCTPRANFMASGGTGSYGSPPMETRSDASQIHRFLRISWAGGSTCLRAAGAVLVASVLGCLVGGPAGADSTGASSGGGTVSVGASSGAGSPGSTGAGGGNGGGPSSQGGGWACISTYLALNNEGGSAPGGPLPGAWYSVTCTNKSSGSQVTQTVWLSASVAAPAPAVDPRTVALQALHSLTLPRPLLRTNPSGASVVNLDTWFWIDPSIWHSYSVSAVAGSVSATAVATPVDVVWSTGDGAQLRCAGPGRRFDPTRPGQVQHAGCTHRYLRTSIGQWSSGGSSDAAAFRISASIDWAVTWTSRGQAGGGQLPGLATSGATSLRVTQIESVGVLPSPTGNSRQTWRYLP